MAIQDIVSHFNTTPFLFAGSGITRRYYGLPNWEGLLAFFAHKVRQDEFSYQYYESLANSVEVANKLPAIASFIEKDYNEKWFLDVDGVRSNNSAVMEAVKNHVSPFKAEIAEYIRLSSVENPDYLQELASLKKISVKNLSGIITTNYDCLFEDLFDGYKVFVGQDELVFSQLQGIAEIYKIHGSITDPASIIINQDDYAGFRNKSKYLAAKLMTIFMEYPIVFIGYSISDPDIQLILSDIVECMPDDKIELLKERFVFVEYNKKLEKPVISSYSMNIQGRIVEMTKIELSDFNLLYESIMSKKAAFPVKLLRRYKDELYSFALTREPGPLMQVTTLDDKRIDENTLALTIGLANTGLYGLKHAVDANRWYRNLILHDLQYPIDDMLQAAYPELLKMYSGTLPVWYYLANSSSGSDLAFSNAPKSYECIVNDTAIKRNKTAAAGRNVAQIWEEEKNNRSRALRIMGSLPEDKVNVYDLKKILQEIFTENPNILEELSQGERSNLRRLIRIYDYLAYSKTKTS